MFYLSLNLCLILLFSIFEVYLFFKLGKTTTERKFKFIPFLDLKTASQESKNIFNKILMVLFIAFLSMPTIVTLIEKNTDVSLFYSFAEEEIHKDLKEIKADLKQQFGYPSLDSKIKLNSEIVSENLSHHDNVAEEIFSPPPELV